MPESPAEKSKNRRKINRLNLNEIEAQLEEIKKTQGGWLSSYAHHLLSRKKALTGQN
ncbi:MAG: hypothetical protein JHC32_05420 [Candidatus Aminicenantes bacterium]|jgi:hypothetical protein|nr:hypothetical protein [Candidatus Aminicenantes bacterium]